MHNYDIQTTQCTVHPDLKKIVEKHRAHVYQLPVTPLQQELFDLLSNTLKNIKKPLILDAGCGTGRSTYQLAKNYPEHFIIGIDKSIARLNQEKSFRTQSENIFFAGENAVLLRADLIYQWLLMSKTTWHFEKIYLLYPNPYPKPAQIKRRFYAHPIFKSLLTLSDHFEIRSNWLLYLEEFALAANYFRSFNSTLSAFTPTVPLSNFEEKYYATQTTVYQLILNAKRNAIQEKY